ncbi:MAG: methyltransferase domain-containing protein [Pirellulales bacterium]|nr:methyltransferase domain-containing protein [Pirellulales bacterium]
MSTTNRQDKFASAEGRKGGGSGTTRERLIAAARDRFYRYGFRDVGIDQILSDVGISKTAFYKHFNSKDALMLAVMRAQDCWLRDYFRELIHQDTSLTPRQRLLAVFDVVDNIVKLDGFRGCFFVNVSMEFPLPHDPPHLAAADNKRAILELVTELAEQAGAENPHELARELSLLMEGAYVTRHVNNDLEAATVARQVAELIINSRIPSAHETGQQGTGQSETGQHETGQGEEPDGRAKDAVRATYNAAADLYDDPVNSYWGLFGRQTIDRLNLASGARVLDVCCGSGASAIPAATAVGGTGEVVGIDLSERLLALARAKAARQGLENVQFAVGDMFDLPYGDAEFDAVVCVFGIFFAKDMSQSVRKLWDWVRPGGCLAITTWGPRIFEPATTAFAGALQEMGLGRHNGPKPWQRVSTTSSMRSVLQKAGVAPREVTAKQHLHPITAPEDAWSIFMGSGYRGVLEQLSSAERERLRDLTIAAIRRDAVRQLEANVIYATAEKPLA